MVVMMDDEDEDEDDDDDDDHNHPSSLFWSNQEKHSTRYQQNIWQNNDPNWLLKKTGKVAAWNNDGKGRWRCPFLFGSITG